MTSSLASDFTLLVRNRCLLNVRDADVLETPQEFCRQFLDLSHSVSVALLKGQIAACHPSRPRRFGDAEIKPVFPSHRGSRRYRGSGNEHVELLKVLKSQVSMLYPVIHRANRHFWGALIEPGSHLEAPFLSSSPLDPIRWRWSNLDTGTLLLLMTDCNERLSILATSCGMIPTS